MSQYTSVLMSLMFSVVIISFDLFLFALAGKKMREHVIRQSELQSS